MYILVAAAGLAAVVAVRSVGAGSVDDVRDLAAREFQASTSAAAIDVAARIATIQGSIRSADGLLAGGVDLGALCQAMSGDPQRPYQRLNVFTVNGNLRCTTVPEARDQPEVIRQRSYFQGALTTGEDQVGGPIVGAFSDRATFAFGHPLRNGGSIVGVIAAALDVTEFVQPIRSLTSSQRIVLIGRDGWFELGAKEGSSLPSAMDSVVSRALATGEVCPVTVIEETAWTCSRVGRTGLVVVTGHPEQSIFAVASDIAAFQRYREIGVVVVAFLAAFGIDFLFVRRMRLAYGNAGLAGLSVADVTDRDEIDALSDWARSTEETLSRLQMEVDGHDERRMGSERDLLTAIAETVEIRYPFLRNHGDRVGRYARQIGTRLGIGGVDLDLMEFAARVHDLGKIAIADAVYLKPGHLEPIEAAQMQLHATRGAEIAGRMRTVQPGVAEAIRHHHERWDGTGYPDGLAGTAIPLWSRVIAVADAYDAMTEERPYRERPRTHDEAIQILRDGAGSQWDTTAVHAFFEVLESGGVQPKPVSIAVRRAAGDA